MPTVIPWTSRVTLVGPSAGRVEDGADRRDDAGRLVAGSGGRLCRVELGAVERDGVGEGPADVHSQQHDRRLCEPLRVGPTCFRTCVARALRRPGLLGRASAPVPGAPSQRRHPRAATPYAATSSSLRPGSRPRPLRRSPRGACARGSSRAPAAARAGRGALARVRPALARDAVELEQLGRPFEQVERERDVALDHVPDPELVAHREVHPHLVEQRARRAREVAAVGAQPANGVLACLKTACRFRASRRVLLVLDDPRGQFPIDRSAEAVHVLSYPPCGPTSPPAAAPCRWFSWRGGDCYTIGMNPQGSIVKE